MPVIDQNRTWVKVEERLSTEQDPVLRGNLEMLLKHMKAEASLDMDALMATVSERAHYHSYSGRGRPNHKGKAAVRKFYEDFIVAAPTSCSTISSGWSSTATAFSPRESCEWPTRGQPWPPWASRWTILMVTTCTKRADGDRVADR